MTTEPTTARRVMNVVIPIALVVLGLAVTVILFATQNSWHSYVAAPVALIAGALLVGAVWFWEQRRDARSTTGTAAADPDEG